MHLFTLVNWVFALTKSHVNLFLYKFICEQIAVVALVIPFVISSNCVVYSFLINSSFNSFGVLGVVPIYDQTVLYKVSNAVKILLFNVLYCVSLAFGISSVIPGTLLVPGSFIMIAG